MDWNCNETSINIPYTVGNLKTLLETLCSKENSFSQYDFVNWCDNLTMVFDNDEGTELDENDSMAFNIARDIECQWDLFLVNTYSLEELQKLDLSKVKLPHVWFIDWLKQLNEKQK
ncbi:MULTISPECIES: hypothetical protein [Metabacillus]|uniref:Uncharacterized protein n=1 Tax=Metabacillus hrfriensis TaxID=3048891 RepID=A0ACD4RHE9_9BACI|nr:MULTISPECIES: hypothetical protein [Metabacillus]UAL54356.1 hypothetical protein K8L98_11530 [Metabacillus dongyingensis]USK30675.1 hypothetical protein LIT32_11430 [Bacillus sp. CMF21]WHZ59925.1 hypothetical protein QLQ22_11555 [Metabacillus sp. CT-WN-B3]